MDELGELYLFREKHISFTKLLGDICKTNFFARIDKKDLFGGLSFFPKITEKIKNRWRIN